MSFKEWFINSVLKYMLSEVVIPFGQWKGQELQRIPIATDEEWKKLDSWVRWVFDTYDVEKRKLRPGQRGTPLVQFIDKYEKEIVEYMKAAKAARQTQQPVQPQEQPQIQQPQEQQPDLTQQPSGRIEPNLGKYTNGIIPYTKAAGSDYRRVSWFPKWAANGILADNKTGKKRTSWLVDFYFDNRDGMDELIQDQDPGLLDELDQIYGPNETRQDKPETGTKEKIDKTEVVKPFVPDDYKIPTPTKEQGNIRSVFTETQSQIIIPALAGSGKTTMLKDLASNIKPGEKWLYLVFNKLNQVESKRDFPQFGKDDPLKRQFDIMTTHAFLNTVFEINPEILPKTSLPREGSSTKVRKLINSYKTAALKHIEKGYHIRLVTDSINELVGLAKNFAIHPDDQDFQEKIEGIIADRAIRTAPKPSKWDKREPPDFTKEIIEGTQYILTQSLPESAGTGMRDERDHDDTVWWTALNANKLKWPKYNVILADEVQDFNKCNQIMLQKLQESGADLRGQGGARIVAVGDSAQAVYSFRGGDIHSIDVISDILGQSPNKSSTQKLSVNFRSGPEIIQYINDHTIINTLQPGKNYESSISTNKTFESIQEIIATEWNTHNELSKETAVICRNNAPLSPVALNLLINDIPATIVGRDLSKEFIQLIEKVRWYDLLSQPQYAKYRGKKKEGGFYDKPYIPYINGAITKAKNDGIKLKEPKILDLSDMLITFGIGSINTSGMDKQDRNRLHLDTQGLNLLIKKLSESNYEYTTKSKQEKRIENCSDFEEYLKYKMSGLDLEKDTKQAEEDIKTFHNKIKEPTKHVLLSSIHKSKGLEFDRVFLLEYDTSLPSDEESLANKTKIHELPSIILEGECLKYVAYSRAKRELNLIPGEQKERETD